MRNFILRTKQLADTSKEISMIFMEWTLQNGSNGIKKILSEKKLPIM